MKNYNKVPLYLGLIVLIGSILTSAIVLGERQSLTYKMSRAAGNEAILTLNFTSPHLVSVYLTGNKEIAGLDIMIKFNGQEIILLPSSLTNGPFFITSGGNVDEKDSTFSFSALPVKTGITSGIVASFNVRTKGSSMVETNLQFVPDDEKTSVWEKVTGSNILTTSTGIKFKLSP